jgi:hypothetical protein
VCACAPAGGYPWWRCMRSQCVLWSSTVKWCTVTSQAPHVHTGGPCCSVPASAAAAGRACRAFVCLGRSPRGALGSPVCWSAGVVCWVVPCTRGCWREGVAPAYDPQGTLWCCCAMWHTCHVCVHHMAHVAHMHVVTGACTASCIMVRVLGCSTMLTPISGQHCPCTPMP